MFRILKTKLQHVIYSLMRYFNAVLILNSSKIYANCIFTCGAKVHDIDGEKRFYQAAGRRVFILLKLESIN